MTVENVRQLFEEHQIVGAGAQAFQGVHAVFADVTENPAVSSLSVRS